MTDEAKESRRAEVPIPSWVVILVSGVLLAGGGAWLTSMSSRINEIDAKLQARDSRLGALEVSDGTRRAQLEEIKGTLAEIKAEIRGQGVSVNAHLSELDIKITAATQQQKDRR